MHRNCPSSAPPPQRSSDIQNLVICGDDVANAATIQRIPSKIFGSLTRLEILELTSIPPMTFSDFAKLACLPRLSDLQVFISGDPLLIALSPISGSHASPTLIFKTLEYFNLDSWSMDSSTAILTLSRFPRLKSIDLTTRSATKLAVLECALQLIHGRCSHSTLEVLRTTTGTGQSDHGEDGVVAITMANLRRFCDFHSLRKLDIFTEMCIVLEDDSVKELAMSWPKLDGLLCFSTAEYPWRHPTATTLEGLAHLARYCPILRTLTIDYNAYDIDISPVV